MNYDNEVFVKIKNQKHPKLKIKTDHHNLKIEYRQVAFDDRYIFIHQKNEFNEWQNIAKLVNVEIADVLIAGLISLNPEEEWEAITDQLVAFWEDVADYDELLDCCDE